MLMMDDTNTKVLNMLITCMKFLEFLIMLQVSIWIAQKNIKENGYHDNHIAPWYKVFIVIRI